MIRLFAKFVLQDLKKSDGDYKKLEQQEDELQTEIADLSKKISKVVADDGSLATLEEQRLRMERTVRELNVLPLSDCE